MSGTVVLLIEDGALRDLRTITGAYETAAAARGLDTDLRLVPGRDELRAEAEALGDELGIVLAATGEPMDEICPDAPAGSIVRLSLDERAADRSSSLHAHIRGRGIGGVRYVIDCVWSHRTSPVERRPYGGDPDQWTSLRLPAGDGPFPVAMLLHGGGWHSRWEADLMDPLAIALARRGVAAWNVEYRRPDEHDMTAAAADVASALAVIADADAPLDPERVVVIGHSAGGQLAIRLAADCAERADIAVRPALSIALAGGLDMVASDLRWMGEGDASRALGGRSWEVPDAYASASPMERLPIGLPIAVACGLDDRLDALDISRAFAAAAAAAGDDVRYIEAPGGHFDIIDPSHPLGATVLSSVDLIGEGEHAGSTPRRGIDRMERMR